MLNGFMDQILLLNKIQLNSFNEKKDIYDAYKIIISNQKIKRKAEIPENSMITILFIEARR